MDRRMCMESRRGHLRSDKSDKKKNVEAMKLIKEEEPKLIEQDRSYNKEFVYQIVELVN